MEEVDDRNIIGGIVLHNQFKKYMIVVYTQISRWFELFYLLCQNSVKRAYDKLCHEVLFCLSNHRDTTVSSPKMGEEEMFTGERT